MPPGDPIRVYDARWEVGEFSDDEVRRLFDAALEYGRLLGADTATLARDGRLGAAHVLELAVEAALDAGFHVYLNPRPIGTPQSYFTTLQVSQDHPLTLGMTVTASHNPKEYVGLKLTVPPVRAIGLDCGPMGGLTQIRGLYHSSGSFARAARAGRPAGGSLETIDLGREYVEQSMRWAGIAPGDLSGLSVVLDGFHGSAGPELSTALMSAGVRVEPLRCTPDGEFPTGSPNPTSRGKMDAALGLARARGCHAVLGVDGDGDRIVFGSQLGILTAGFAFLPVLRTCGVSRSRGAGAPRLPGEGTFLSPGGGVPVLHDPKVSPVALVEWTRLGARPVLFRNGHSQIKDHMMEIGALAGAEESGHYYHRVSLGNLTVSAENSVLTVLWFLKALKRQPDLLDELWQLEETAHTTGELNHQVSSDEVRDAALAALAEHFKADGAEVAYSTPDGVDLQGTCIRRGVKVDTGEVTLERGWYSGYIRPATNERSVVRSYFSAGSEETCDRIERAARMILEDHFGGRVVD